MRQKVADNPYRPVRRLYSELLDECLLSGDGDLVACAPRFPSIKSSLYRERQKAVPSLVLPNDRDDAPPVPEDGVGGDDDDAPPVLEDGVHGGDDDTPPVLEDSVGGGDDDTPPVLEDGAHGGDDDTPPVTEAGGTRETTSDGLLLEDGVHDRSDTPPVLEDGVHGDDDTPPVTEAVRVTTSDGLLLEDGVHDRSDTPPVPEAGTRETTSDDWLLDERVHGGDGEVGVLSSPEFPSATTNSGVDRDRKKAGGPSRVSKERSEMRLPEAFGVIASDGLLLEDSVHGGDGAAGVVSSTEFPSATTNSGVDRDRKKAGGPSRVSKKRSEIRIPEALRMMSPLDESVRSGGEELEARSQEFSSSTNSSVHRKRQKAVPSRVPKERSEIRPPVAFREITSDGLLFGESVQSGGGEEVGVISQTAFPSATKSGVHRHRKKAVPSRVPKERSEIRQPVAFRRITSDGSLFGESVQSGGGEEVGVSSPAFHSATNSSVHRHRQKAVPSRVPKERSEIRPPVAFRRITSDGSLFGESGGGEELAVSFQAFPSSPCKPSSLCRKRQKVDPSLVVPKGRSDLRPPEAAGRLMTSRDEILRAGVHSGGEELGAISQAVFPSATKSSAHRKRQKAAGPASLVSKERSEIRPPVAFRVITSDGSLFGDSVQRGREALGVSSPAFPSSTKSSAHRHRQKAGPASLVPKERSEIRPPVAFREITSDGSLFGDSVQRGREALGVSSPAFPSATKSSVHRHRQKAAGPASLVPKERSESRSPEAVVRMTSDGRQFVQINYGAGT